MNKTKPKIPAGFLELLPADQIAFKKMLSTIQKVYEQFGFTPIETPALEFSEVLLAKAGGETEKQIYELERGDKKYCLHFDLTVPLARYVAEHFNDLVFPFRRYQIQKVWRAERPQKGRFREFYQCDIDVIGSTNPLIDAEMVSVINSVFTELKLGGFVVHISNRKIAAGFLNSLDLKEKSSQILRLIDKIDRQERKDLEKEMEQIDLTSKQIESIFSFVSIGGSNKEIISYLKELQVTDELFNQGLIELETVVDGITSLGVPESNFKINLKIARGLDYYTGTVYETFLTDYPSFGSVCSGGRFDDLASHYANEKLPGVGISIGLTRLFSQLKANEAIDNSIKTTAKVLVAQMDAEFLPKCLEVASIFRKAEINTEVYFDSEKIGKQIKYADRLSIPFVIIIGEQEQKKDTVTLKDMKSGEQFSLTTEEAIKKISSN